MPSSEAEAELREVLRLEEIERRRRSLRSAPVAQTYRGVNVHANADIGGGEREVSAEPQTPPNTQTAQTYFGPPPAVDQALQQSLDMLNTAVSELETAAQSRNNAGGA